MSLPELKSSVLSTGKLSQHSLVELLGVAFAHKRSGKLQLMRGRTNVTVHLYNGIPVNAASNAPQQGILDLMVHDHRLAPDDVLQVKKLAEDKKMDIERCLRELLEVTESQIYYYRQQAVRDLVIKTCGWRDGSFVFESGDEFMASIDMYDLNPLDLVYEGIVKYRSNTLAADVHSAEQRLIRLNPDNHEYFLLPGPLYDHSDILDIFNEGIMVSAAVHTLQQEFGNINLALTALYLLFVTGLVIFPSISEDEVFDADELFQAPPPPEEEKPTKERRRPVRMAPPKVERVRDVVRSSEAAAPAKPARPAAGAPTPPPPTAPAEPNPPAPPAEDMMPADESSVYIISKPRKLKKGHKPKEPDKLILLEDDEEVVDAKPVSPAAPPRSKPEPAATEPAAEKAERKPIHMRLTSPPRPEKEPEAPAPEDEPRGDHGKRVAIMAGDIVAAVTHYDVLGVNAGTDLPDLQKQFATRRRHLLDGLQGEAPDETRAVLEQALKKVEESVAVLTDASRRVEYERLLAPEEKKRAWNLQAKKNLAHKMSERGKWYMLANAPEHARAFYAEAIELDPENPSYFTELGWAIFRHRPQEVDEARSYLASAVRIDPGSDRAYYYLGVIAKRRGDDGMAEKMFRRAVELNPALESARRELAYLNQHQKQTGLWKKIFGG